MFGMLSVLAELQRELIVANTRDGLAALTRVPHDRPTPPGTSQNTAPDAGQHNNQRLPNGHTTPSTQKRHRSLSRDRRPRLLQPGTSPA